MKKIILSLLAILTIASADSVTLKCSFPGHEDGKIRIETSPQKSLTYLGSGGCDISYSIVSIDNIQILAYGNSCSIYIRREDGIIRVTPRNEEGFKGTCTKQSNTI